MQSLWEKQQEGEVIMAKAHKFNQTVVKRAHAELQSQVDSLGLHSGESAHRLMDQANRSAHVGREVTSSRICRTDIQEIRTASIDANPTLTGFVSAGLQMPLDALQSTPDDAPPINQCGQLCRYRRSLRRSPLRMTTKAIWPMLPLPVVIL